MSDEPFRFPISPIVMERNARRLVDIMAQFFPDGATSKDLQIRFEQVTGLQRQTFYDTIGFVKYKRWFVGGGKNKIYRLNSDGSWKLTQTSDGQILERDQLTHLVTVQTQQIGELRGEVVRLRDWASGDANGANNVALSNLIKIVADNSASTRQRLRAAAAVLSYKTPDDVTDFVKKYLESLCGSDEATDYKIEASELLRKHEAPRIISETVRPSYRDSGGSEAERTESWQSYLYRQRKWKLVMDSQVMSLEPDAPHRLPAGWCDDLYADDFVAPQSGWPPW